jgi:hypothetical protein
MYKRLGTGFASRMRERCSLSKRLSGPSASQYSVGRRIGIGAVVLLLVSACRNPQRMGEELYPPPATVVETLQVSLATPIFLPEPSTERAPFVFVGETIDTLIGQLSAQWATQFALGGENVRFYTDALVGIDSVVLELFIASSYGNIGIHLRVQVERLTQPLTAGQGYTTATTFSGDGQQLVLPGYDTLRYETFSPGAKRFRLDTALGRYILTLPEAALANQSAFVSAFPGLLIKAEAPNSVGNGAIYTVFPRSPQTALRIYYRERIQGQEVPQQYSFAITDTCVWAYNLRRQGVVGGVPVLRDSLQTDSTIAQQKLLLAGGLPVGVRLGMVGWERLFRAPVLSARLILHPAEGYRGAYSAFYPRVAGVACYADTTAEAATASWGIGDFAGDSIVIDVTIPVQEVLTALRPPPNQLYLWPVGRQYTLTRWVMSGVRSHKKPYLLVILARP